MNSRTVHIVLFFLVVLASFVTVSHVQAQTVTEKNTSENAKTPVSQPIKNESAEIYAQLPIITSEVGNLPEETEKKVTLQSQQSKEVKSAAISPTKKPEKKTAPTPTKLPDPTPTAKPEFSSLSTVGGLDAEKLFAMSNEYRIERGLAPFEKDDKSCSLAASRAPEVAGEVAAGTLHSGLHARNLDYWNTENIISMRTEESAFNWWVNDKIHHDAIVGDFKYSCVACHGNNCAQEFTNYQPK